MKNDVLAELLVPGTDEDVVANYATLADRSQGARFGFEEDEIVILDIETTGFIPSSAEIIEIAAAIVKGPEVLARFSTLVRPRRRIPEEIVRLTGITDEMVARAPTVDAALADFLEFVGNRDLVAHNSSFDRSFLEHCAGAGAFSGSWMDSLQLARIALPRLRSHRLSDLATAFTDTTPTHRAGSDVEALAKVWRVLLVALGDLPPGLLDFIYSLHPSVKWPLRSVFALVAAASPQTQFDLKRIRTVRVAADKEMAKPDSEDVDLTFPDTEQLAARFSPEGTAGRMYPGYESREEQIVMAREVLDAFRMGTHRALEAGTGVGKSVAYLMPSVLFAQQNDITVGVATKTNALMDQLVYHELPKLSAALETPLRYTALKGYEHYPCLRKMDRFAREDGADTDTLTMLAMLHSWSAQSSWGDLDSLNLYWRKLPKRTILSTQAECLKARCRYYPGLCYLHGSRRRAASADVVVTNHALLFRDIVAEGGILPPIRHWIIDEAHSVETEARRQLAIGVSGFSLDALIDTLHSKRGGVLSNIRRKSATLAGADVFLGTVAKLEEQALLTKTISGSFFSFVKDLADVAGEGTYDSVDLWVNQGVRDSMQWGAIVSAGKSLVARLDDLLALCKTLVSSLGEFGADLADVRADLSGISMRVSESREGLVTVLEGSDPDLVYSAKLDRRAEVLAESLAAVRLDIGEVLVEYLYPRVRSVIFTSATIATGESFEHFSRGVGLSRLDREKWSSLRLASSYDFERNMGVYIPADMPEPNSPAYLPALERLLFGVHVSMGGSVLTLFTNRREMERMYHALKPRLEEEGLDLIHQSIGTSAKQLRDEFLADEQLSLFALRSFWEGFDAPGSTLRCVVVPRLPFGVPTDPLSRERELRESGAWRRYVLPEAVIDLKQAAGRLIRSSTDTGCLIIADSRVVGKSYGKSFLEALPVDTSHHMKWSDLFDDIAGRFGKDAE